MFGCFQRSRQRSKPIPIPKSSVQVAVVQNPVVKKSSIPIPKPVTSASKSSAVPQKVGHRDRIPTAVRNGVWLRYHGERAVGQCYCCGVWITRYNKGWHCANVKADVNG